MSDLKNTLWVEKYRPSKLEGYVGNEDAVKLIEKYIHDQDIPHLMFSGRAGTGKTTIAKIITNNIDCDRIYINASDENNVDTIRDKIRHFVMSQSLSSNFKIVVLDEADGLTPSAQRILRNMMEKYSRTSRFILTCNYPERIIPALVSRCTEIDIQPNSMKVCAMRAFEILDAEGVLYDKKDVATIVKAEYPDMRKVIGQLQENSRLVDGDLVLQLSEKNRRIQTYVNEVVNILKDSNNLTVTQAYEKIRKVISSSGSRTFDDLYDELYESASQFATNDQIPFVILKIRNAVIHDINCVNKEINVMALIIEILEIIK